MHPRSIARARLLVAGLIGVLVCAALRPARAPAAGAVTDLPPRTAVAWTADEARQEMRLHPHDAYLQYVLMQLRPPSQPDQADFIGEVAGGGGRGAGAGGGGPLATLSPA